ncbi:MAG TPA: ATPase, T2SS/T4P/T4SS family [Nitriliruptorales bacterium]
MDSSPNSPAPAAHRAATSAGLRDPVRSRIGLDPEVAAAPADRSVLRRAVARALAAEGVVVAPARWAQLVRDLVDELGGLGPLEALLRDPEVTDVLVNAHDEIWVERAGALERVDVAFDGPDHVRETLARVLGPLGVRLDRGRPFADAVLPGGVRLHALLPPLVGEPTVTLRRVAPVVPSWDELADAGAVPGPAADVLRQLVRDRANLVVTGRAGSGKTTLLARLLHEAAPDRIVVIEDAPELRVSGGHVVHLQVVPPSADGGMVADVASLLRNALRMRPDRLVIGEVRGAEVADLLQAMNTGHHGSMTTVHANGARDALTRLEGMALLAGVPIAAARAQLATAVDAVATLQRASDGRRHVTAVVAVEVGEATVRTRELWP